MEAMDLSYECDLFADAILAMPEMEAIRTWIARAREVLADDYSHRGCDPFDGFDALPPAVRQWVES
jgi:hypothetical protein